MDQSLQGHGDDSIFAIAPLQPINARVVVTS